MARTRSVGKQAAADEDFVQLGVLRGYLNALPGIYLELSRLNQPNGVPQLDANARMGNAYLPTDISRTNLTATTKVTTAALQATGAATVDSLAVAKGATVGGTLGVTGAATAASLDVGTGNVKAATETVPENTATTFKAKATTLDSLTVSGASAHGATTVASLSSAGDIVGSGTTGKLQVPGDVIAGTDVRGRDFVTSRNLQVAGSSFLQDTNVAGTLKGINADGTAKALPVSGDMTASGVIRGAAVTAAGNMVADQIMQGTAGIQTPGTLTVQGASDMGSIAAAGDVIGQGIVQAMGQLKGASLAVNGAMTGATSTVTGKATSGDINTGLFKSTNQAHLASDMVNDGSHMLINGKFVRQYGQRFEMYQPQSGYARWIPNFASAVFGVKPPAAQGTNGQSIPYNQTTRVNMTVKSSHTQAYSDSIFTMTGGGIRVGITGWFSVTAKATMAIPGGKVFACNFQVDNIVQQHTNRDMYCGAKYEQWSNITADNTAMLFLTAGQVVYFNVYHNSTFDAGGSFNTNIVSEGGSPWQSCMYIGFLGNTRIDNT